MSAITLIAITAKGFGCSYHFNEHTLCLVIKILCAMILAIGLGIAKGDANRITGDPLVASDFIGLRGIDILVVFRRGIVIFLSTRR